MTDFSELPLVFFTTLSQMAVGAFVVLYLLRKNDHIQEMAADRIAVIVVVLMALAMGGASTHLGDPVGGWRALLGLEHSWLSREIFVMSGFLGLAFLYALPQLKSFRSLAGLLGVVFGVVGIVVTAMVYTLPARPAWNSPYPLLFFALTALSAGPLLVSYIVHEQEGTICQAALKLTSFALIAGFIVSVLYASQQSANLAMPAGWLALRCLIGQLLPAALLYKLTQQPAGRNLLMILVLVVLGELLGRQLFYGSVLAYPLFPF
ncbi:anaerobic dimethyl sulfoxide reductase subunit C (DMSO reductase anchor subunit) [Selenomonas sp. GACV-9]|uniref:dimethyl sulfoxide reductase anchor subunit family protein n=1 Tax=Selenomonas sp. GACV-9 TaxID=3158782 RepID=UPI0008F2B219|nr:anaerobic dimethyl sulfoxide reductase subunit C (DMSO reductase anchor subunit) [Selenomonas ruminantium]